MRIRKAYKDEKTYRLVANDSSIFHWLSGFPAEPVKVLDHVRILHPYVDQYSFTYELKDHHFWTLMYSEVPMEALDNIDFLEGTHNDLFKREEVLVERKTGEVIKAFMYVPTDNCKKYYELDYLIYDRSSDDELQHAITLFYPKLVCNFPDLLNI
ncbi:MAG: gamma-glutamylcyclotransferase [Candidatus Odinarchaeia archaeon]|nr:MAG: hypothetical protein [Lokiarchaeota virus Fenrir Meg22_1012]URC17300.1 MAG: hypothetical protein [Lokiarchaeota virus Fenrir Meg22_1214]